MNKLDSIELAIEKIYKMYGSCSCCAHKCSVDRTENKLGFCKVQEDISHVKVASHTLHFGEEPMLVGEKGSGTVFFSNCNLMCVFCQNYQISSLGMGSVIDTEKLASYYLELQDKGALNINLVSATHVIYQAVSALKLAFEKGLNIPIVYNTNGYDSLELIEALDGAVDIYLPDIKYYNNSFSEKYSHAKNYFDAAITAIKKMYEQVGSVKLDEKGILTKGLIIRHLVLPANISGSYDILLALKENGLTEAALSLMSQYSPEYKAKEYPELSKGVSKKEYDGIVDYALDLGFENIFVQDFESVGNYTPDFEKEKPFV